MTVNRMNKNIDVNDYYITFDNTIQHIHHEVEYQKHAYNFVKGLNFSNFPVTLNVNNKFKKMDKLVLLFKAPVQPKSAIQ